VFIWYEVMKYCVLGYFKNCNLMFNKNQWNYSSKIKLTPLIYVKVNIIIKKIIIVIMGLWH